MMVLLTNPADKICCIKKYRFFKLNISRIRWYITVRVVYLNIIVIIPMPFLSTTIYRKPMIA